MGRRLLGRAVAYRMISQLVEAGGRNNFILGYTDVKYISSGPAIVIELGSRSVLDSGLLVPFRQLP
jgi:hypothetical protein